MAAIAKWTPARIVSVDDIIEPRNKLTTMYKCTVSTGAKKTGDVEPTWPDTIGVTVNDGDLTWTTVEANYITWIARNIYKTYTTEPTWPTVPGDTVVDAYALGGEVTWKARTPEITDPKCPHTEIAYPMSQKVFAPGAGTQSDVLRYSTTNDPRNWSDEDDAGFLATGQNAPESVETTAVGEYRGRLAVFTASGCQIWTPDPDPAEMALFDSIKGIGTNYMRAHASVAGDLFFLTTLGVRTLSVAAGSTNLQAGDVGTGIDSLVYDSMQLGDDPIGLYYPGQGQYWLAFPGDDTTDVYVYSMPELGKRGSWSRYEFPWVLECATQLDGELYLRANDNLYFVDELATRDETSSGAFVGYQGLIQWPYLDLGSPGTTKMLISCDVAGIGIPFLSVAYDQNNLGSITTPYQISDDTTYGSRVPIAVSSPSFSVKLTWPADRAGPWQLNSFDLFVDDMRTGV